MKYIKELVTSQHIKVISINNFVWYVTRLAALMPEVDCSQILLPGTRLLEYIIKNVDRTQTDS